MLSNKETGLKSLESLPMFSGARKDGGGGGGRGIAVSAVFMASNGG